MKYIIITALLLSAIFSASAQSALEISWVTYPTSDHKNPLPLQPGQTNTIRVYLHNTGNHPVKVLLYRCSVDYDGLVGPFKGAQFQKKSHSIINPLTRANNLAYFFDIRMGPWIDPEDSISLQKGKAVLNLLIEYWDIFQHEKREYSCIMTLKDHHSPASLTDRVIYKEDKREGRP